MATAQDTSTHVHMLVNRSAAFAVLTCQACRQHVQHVLSRDLHYFACVWIRDGKRWCGSAQICHMLILEIRYSYETLPNNAT